MMTTNIQLQRSKNELAFRQSVAARAARAAANREIEVQADRAGAKGNPSYITAREEVGIRGERNAPMAGGGYHTGAAPGCE